jgi:hypothetical protein
MTKDRIVVATCQKCGGLRDWSPIQEDKREQCRAVVARVHKGEDIANWHVSELPKRACQCRGGKR